MVGRIRVRPQNGSCGSKQSESCKSKYHQTRHGKLHAIEWHPIGVARSSTPECELLHGSRYFLLMMDSFLRVNKRTRWGCRFRSVDRCNSIVRKTRGHRALNAFQALVPIQEPAREERKAARFRVTDEDERDRFR